MSPRNGNPLLRECLAAIRIQGAESGGGGPNQPAASVTPQLTREFTPALTPGWSRKPTGARLVRYLGEYLTPAQVAERVQIEAREYLAKSPASPARIGDGASRVVDGGAPDLGASPEHQFIAAGGCGRAHTPTPHPADRSSSIEPTEGPRPEAGAGSLPCRSLGTSQTGGGDRGGPGGLNSAHRKTALALSWNVAFFVEKFGIERCGFLTLTFADHVLDPKEAQRRLNNLMRRAFADHYCEYIRVMERQKSGRIHYHLLVACNHDIRSGVDVDAIAAGDYTSVPPRHPLRMEWAFLHKTLKAYGFGRHNLQPIKGTGDALGQYVGKYIGKHINQREERDKGARLVAYTRGARCASSRFTRIGSKLDSQWRAKVQTFCRMVEYGELKRSKNPHGTLRVRTMDDLASVLGKRWAFEWREFIYQLPPADLTVPF
jgi:hypothetical protein